MDNSTGMRKAWAEITGVVPTDTASLLQRVGIVLCLVDDTKRAVLRLDDLDHNLFLSWEKPVTSAFSRVHFDDENIHRLKQQLTPDAMRSLQFCDHELTRRAPEPQLDPEMLEQLLCDVADLAERVRQSHLPPHIMTFLLDKLDLLERALVMYRFTGAVPVERALESVVGATWRHRDGFGDVQHDPIWQSFWELCGRIETLVFLAETGQKLLEWVPRLLAQE